MVTVEQICEAFWQLEERHKLLDWRLKEVAVWPLLRMRLYYSIARQIGTFDAPHPILRVQATATAGSKSARVQKRITSHLNLLKWYISLTNAQLLARCCDGPKYALLLNDRRVGGVDIYSDALHRELKEVVLLDRTRDGAPSKGLFNFAQLGEVYRRRYAHLERIELAVADEQLCMALREYFHRRLGVDVGDLAREVLDAARQFRSQSRGFKEFFAARGTTTLFAVNAYNRLPIVAGAHAAGARVVELQHGFISPFHLGYSWPGRPLVPYAPDELWCFGRFWFETTELPSQTKSRVIGAPYVESLAELHTSGKDETLIVVTSQGVVGKLLFAIAIEAARLRPDRQFVFRLHPSELLGDYEALFAEQADVPENFSLSHRDPNIFALLARASVQVGAFSTTLLEGMALGTRTIVMDLPGVEYMRPVIARGDALLVRSAAELAARLDEAPAPVDPSYYYAPPVKPLL